MKVQEDFPHGCTVRTKSSKVLFTVVGWLNEETIIVLSETNAKLQKFPAIRLDRMTPLPKPDPRWVCLSEWGGAPSGTFGTLEEARRAARESDQPFVALRTYSEIRRVDWE